MRSELPSAVVHCLFVKNDSYQRSDHVSGGKTNEALPVKLSGMTTSVGAMSHRATSMLTTHRITRVTG